MMSLRSFFGFLSPKLVYSQDELSVEAFPIPEKAILLIQKVEDKITAPELKPGDAIKSGQSILSKSRKKEVLAYSSVTGTVKEIYDLNWIDGIEYTAISVETSEEDDWDTSFEGDDNFLEKDSEELLSILNNAGFDISPEKADTLIVNCLESDLLVSNNANLLRDNSENIKSGISLMKKVTGAGDILIATTKELESRVNGISTDGAVVSIVKPHYPNSMDQMLCRALLKDEANNRKCVVVNLENLNAMVTALKSGQPFVEKMITLVDKGNKPLKNIKVRVGTPVSEILKANNIDVKENGRVILGGQMLGKAIQHMEFPVTTETEAIVVQESSEIYEISNMACVNCGKCVKACPYNLQVNLLSRCSEFSVFEKCEELDINFCIECGLCSYVCTTKRPLVQFIQFAKKEIEKLKKEEEE